MLAVFLNRTSPLISVSHSCPRPREGLAPFPGPFPAFVTGQQFGNEAREDLM